MVTTELNRRVQISARCVLQVVGSAGPAVCPMCMYESSEMNFFVYYSKFCHIDICKV